MKPSRDVSAKFALGLAIFSCLLGLAWLGYGNFCLIRYAGQSDAKCLSCHAMKAFVPSSSAAKMGALADIHGLNGDLGNHACVSCHVGPGLMQWLGAKITGAGHLLAQARGVSKSSGLNHPWTNAQCLQCHENENRFVRQKAHLDEWKRLKTGRKHCVDCHTPAHLASSSSPAHGSLPPRPKTQNIIAKASAQRSQ